MIKKIFTNSAGILLSRILGFIRDLLTASILGANIYSDIFFVAFKLPNLFRRIFGEGAFVQSFLPSFSASRHKALFSAAIFWRFFWLILGLSLLVTLFNEFFTRLIALGFNERLIELAAPYVALNFYYLDLIFCVTFLAALLQYKEHFATTAFSTALLNLSLITALVLFAHSAKPQIVWAMSVAVLIGGALQLLLHLWMAKRFGITRWLLKALVVLPKKKALVQKDLQRFYQNFFPAIWGNSTAQISAFLDTWLASFLAAGSISYLYYANRVFQLPLALFAIATATALFPSVSKALAKKDEAKALAYFSKSFTLLLWLLSASTLGGVILSKEIVWLLFERGNFTRADTLAASKVLAMYMVGLLPYGLSKLLSLWLYATHRQKEAARIATYSLATNIVGSLVLLFFYQAAGLALASSLAGWVLLYKNIQLFGQKRFWQLCRQAVSMRAILAIIALTIALIFIKKVLDGYL